MPPISCCLPCCSSCSTQLPSAVTRHSTSSAAAAAVAPVVSAVDGDRMMQCTLLSPLDWHYPPPTPTPNRKLPAHQFPRRPSSRVTSWATLQCTTTHSHPPYPPLLNFSLWAPLTAPQQRPSRCCVAGAFILHCYCYGNNTTADTAAISAAAAAHQCLQYAALAAALTAHHSNLGQTQLQVNRHLHAVRGGGARPTMHMSGCHSRGVRGLRRCA